MTTNKLDEIEGRHKALCEKVEFGYEFWDGNGAIAHEDRAYLLSRVRELEAADAAMNELVVNLQEECTRLRVILNAPVTEEELSIALATYVGDGKTDMKWLWPTKDLLREVLTSFSATRRSK